MFEELKAKITPPIWKSVLRPTGGRRQERSKRPSRSGCRDVGRAELPRLQMIGTISWKAAEGRPCRPSGRGRSMSRCALPPDCDAIAHLRSAFRAVLHAKIVDTPNRFVSDEPSSHPLTFQPIRPRPRPPRRLDRRSANRLHRGAGRDRHASRKHAARVGMSDTSAYALRRRPCGAPFREAWDAAMDYSLHLVEQDFFIRSRKGGCCPADLLQGRAGRRVAPL